MEQDCVLKHHLSETSLVGRTLSKQTKLRVQFSSSLPNVETLVLEAVTPINFA